MATTQEPVEDFQQLYEELKKYVQLQVEYTKVEIVEKITIFLSTLIIASLLLILALAVLFYLCFSLAYVLEPVLGSLALSYAVISVIYLLLIVLLIAFRKRLVVNPLVRFLSRLLLKDKEEL